MTEREIEIIWEQFGPILTIKRFADSFDQLCFQMERMWFGLFKNRAEAHRWFCESSDKTLRASAFVSARNAIAQAVCAIDRSSNPKKSLVHMIDELWSSYEALEIWGNTADADEYYRAIRTGEEKALALAHALHAVLLEMHAAKLAG